LPALGLDDLAIGGRRHAVRALQRCDMPFATMIELSHAGTAARPPILVVPPWSGHLPILLRELVGGLLQRMPVVVLAWREPRHVPLADGPFGFDDNIMHIVSAIRELGPAVLVAALCQAVVPTLAATALVATQDHDAAPRGLALMAGPVDPLANPTRVVRLLRACPLEWFRKHVITTVPADEPGAGRPIYPASAQRAGLLAYLARHMTEGGELFWKTVADDGADPIRYPFLRLFLSLMDLPAELFLENAATVFHDRRLCTGRLSVGNRRIDLSALRRTALMTIEAEGDDIAAPGQTRAAHRLCAALPDKLHHHLLVQGSGHFSLFHGAIWRKQVLPSLARFDALTLAH
jgi:poly(3-hydroxybutyrate) depolymerase